MNRLVFPHGLGDCIQALPSLRRYAERVGPLVVGVLGRLPACAEVVDDQPWCVGTFPVEDPWGDGPEMFAAKMSGLESHGRVLWTSRPADPLSPLVCKAARIAAELGVEWEPENPWPGEPRSKLSNFAVLHGQSGNPIKDVEHRNLYRIAREIDPGIDTSVDVAAGESVARNRRRFEVAGLFVGVDSGPAHLASCTDTPVVWVFKRTPIEQAIPLWRPVRVVVVGPEQDAIVASWERWRSANAGMVRHEVLVTNGARDA